MNFASAMAARATLPPLQLPCCGASLAKHLVPSWFLSPWHQSATLNFPNPWDPLGSLGIPWGQGLACWLATCSDAAKSELGQREILRCSPRTSSHPCGWSILDAPVCPLAIFRLRYRPEEAVVWKALHVFIFGTRGTLHSGFAAPWRVERLTKPSWHPYVPPEPVGHRSFL